MAHWQALALGRCKKPACIISTFPSPIPIPLCYDIYITTVLSAAGLTGLPHDELCIVSISDGPARYHPGIAAC